MAEYLYSARAKSGAEIKDRIEAASAAAALAELKAQGFADIVIHNDDFDARLYGANFSQAPKHIDAAALIEARRQGGLGSLLWGVMKGNAVVLVLLLAWNAYSYNGERPFGWSDWLGFALTGLLLFVMFWSTLPAALFEAVLKAQLWARWSDAERWLALLRRCNYGAKLAPHMLDFYQAKSLIGMGKIEAGLALYERYAGQAQVPEALFLSLKAALLDEAKRFDKAGELMRQLTEIMPDSAQVWLDLALNQAQHGELEAAKQALAEAEQLVLNPIMAAVAPLIRGQISLREKYYQDATKAFQEALVALAPFARQTALGPVFVLAEAKYAIALAYCGELAEARRAWAIAGPVLEAQAERKLIAEWQDAEAAGGHLPG